MADERRAALVERMARAMLALDSGPEGSVLFDLHLAEFGEGYLRSASAALDLALEEAGTVLDEKAQEWNRKRDPGMANQARAYATAIRNLKDDK